MLHGGGEEAHRTNTTDDGESVTYKANSLRTSDRRRRRRIGRVVIARNDRDCDGLFHGDFNRKGGTVVRCGTRLVQHTAVTNHARFRCTHRL
jgi:hypothetical protein